MKPILCFVALGLVIFQMPTVQGYAQEPYFEHITFSPAEPTDADSIIVTLSGVLSNLGPSWDVTGSHFEADLLYLDLEYYEPEIVLPMMTEFEFSHNFGTVPAGEYGLVINIHWVVDGVGEGDDGFAIAGPSITRGPAFEVPLHRGWNLISIPRIAYENTFEGLFAPLIDAGVLVMVRDGDGRFMRPDRGFSNLPDFDPLLGYQVMASDACTLRVEGRPVSAAVPIPLSEGWNMVAYLPAEEQEARPAFEAIRDELIIAKNGSGNFYVTSVDFSNLPPLSQGQGYQVKVRQDVEMVWRQP